MRLIAEEVISPTAAGTTFVSGEMVSNKPKPLPPPKHGYGFHVYCSEGNPGALALVQELAERRGCVLKMSSSVGGDARQVRALRTHASKSEVLFATTDAQRLTECEHMLLYLNGQTWTRGEASEALGKEVQQARELGVHVLLTHESARTHRWLR
jgi:hypothetical protein